MGLSRLLRGAAIDVLLGSKVERLARTGATLGRVLSGGRRVVEFYYQVDDPYSHLLVQLLSRLLAAAPEAKIDLELIVVPPAAVDVDPEPALRAAYAPRDAALLSRYYNLDFPDAWETPAPDRVRRVAAVLLESRPMQAQLEAARVLGDALWRGDGDALASAVTDLGAVAGQDVTPRLEENYARLRQRGHYIGGTIRYGAEWYWGVDRMGHLAARLRDEGVLHDEARLLSPRAVGSLPLVPKSTVAGEGPTLELFFSFRSPYSYLALRRVRALVERYGVTLRVRPVLPMVMRGLPVPRPKRLYIVRDAKREATRLGVPFGRICDPLGSGVERCLAVFPLAESRGLGFEFVESAARGIWSEALDVASDAGLRTVIERVGISWEEASEALNDSSWRAMAEENRAALFAHGLWGVPTLVLGELAVWGQDRLPILEARLEGAALRVV